MLVSRSWRQLGHLGPRGPETGEPVLVIPGFIANDRTTMELRRALAEAGYRAFPWNGGFNRGARADTIERLRARIDAISPDKPLVVVGWDGDDDLVDAVRMGYPSREMATEVKRETRASFQWAVELVERGYAPGHLVMELDRAQQAPTGPEPLVIKASYVHLGVWRQDVAPFTCAW